MAKKEEQQKEKSSSSTTKVVACDCDHVVKDGVYNQDAIYGRGKRLHNRSNKAPAGWRCTVCKKRIS